MNVEGISWEMPESDRVVMGLGQTARFHLVVCSRRTGGEHGVPFVDRMINVHGKEAEGQAETLLVKAYEEIVSLAVGQAYMIQYHDPRYPSRRDEVLRRHKHTP